jgi:hypothetical protein
MSRCEAMVLYKTSRGDRYAACGRDGADLHHKLTRARGGLILDAAGETYHHLYLCREHHQVAHDRAQAFESGLLIHGYVITGPSNTPQYTGPDAYLTEHYGEKVHT